MKKILAKKKTENDGTFSYDVVFVVITVLARKHFTFVK